MYKGNYPNPTDGWEMVGAWRDEDGENVGWTVFMRPQQNSDEWATFKICADGKVESKANYWSVRKNTGQIGYVRDMAMMRAHRPKLHAAVEKIMEDAQ